jgi:hypothetical protein
MILPHNWIEVLYCSQDTHTYFVYSKNDFVLRENNAARKHGTRYQQA